MADVLVPHFAIPFVIDNGSAVVLEQDSIDEVAQCVSVLVSTPVGSRIEQPDYGIPDPLFSVDTDKAAIVSAINEWEPRAVPNVSITPDPSVISVSVDDDDELVRHIRIRVSEASD